MSFDARLQRLWYGPAWRSLPLWPLELLFRLAVALKGLLFRMGLRRVCAAISRWAALARHR
jgi:tetraacyldisaccharide-1-P 4'-kinase